MIADLRELARRTGDERGAQRLCWTETWREARAFLAGLLAEIGVEAERDAAGNLWAQLDGGGGAPLAVGSHLDSVPDGGWLDGALGVMAAVGVLRAWAGAGAPPPRPLVARRLGRRGGRALRPQPVRQLGVLRLARSRTPSARSATRTGPASPTPSPPTASRSTRVLEAGERDPLPAAYLELHIEQGPVLEAEGVAGERGRRLRRGRAPALALRGPGRARRDDADGPAPRRGPRGGRDGARDRADRRRARRRRDHRRARARARDRDRRRRRRRALGRPSPPPTRSARRDARRGARRGRRRSRRGAVASSPRSRSGGSSRSGSIRRWSRSPPRRRVRRAGGPSR